MMRALLLLLLGCGTKSSDPASTDTGAGTVDRDCDPIAPSRCALPYPSTYFMREEAASPTGWRIALGETTFPANIDGVQPSPEFINEKDGFSPVTPVITHMVNATADGLISHTDLDAYRADDAKTVIINLETGERVPHFAELDVTAEWDHERMLILHPVVPMDYGARYAVGIRGVVDSTGATIEASEGFAALRDGTASTDPRIEERRALYDDLLFPALRDAGFPQDELQLAWDFVIGSREGITGKATHMRDDLFERLGDAGPAYTISEVQEQPNENTGRRIRGTMTVPLYTDIDGPGALLNRDADGMPYAEGTTEVPFTIIVPTTAFDDPRPLPLIQYGHGLLGGQGEVTNGYLSEFANDHGYILFAVDWTGMKGEDSGPISLMLVQEIHKFAMIPERSQQGFVEFLAAMEMMTGPMTNDEHLMAPDSEGTMVSLIDPDRTHYYGNSQGAIMGGGYIALSPRIERATLGVGGSPYHLLLNRSADFDPFFLIFKTMYPDALDVQFILALNQTLWDAGESAGYLNAITRDPLEGVGPKSVLLQVAIGDAQVTTLGAHVMARSYDAPMIAPTARDVYGIETVPSGHVGSALVEFDYGLYEPPENIPPDPDTDPHERPRRDAAGMLQMHTFFSTGVVEQYCEGPCGELD
ncbi:MAG: hypothetical protein VX944_15450 [Myxococcota bacterium]|nr:hypothetical protein [Myxococcota bacterium]